MNTICNNLLRQCFLYLHPLTLQECKLVCKRWHQVMIQKETAIWFFKQRYQAKIPTNLTFWHQYLPLPGGERYRTLKECHQDTLRNKDKTSHDYFMKNIRHGQYLWEYIMDVTSLTITKEQFEFIRSFIIYEPMFNYFDEFGIFVGLLGDISIYEEELAKIPKYSIDNFVAGFLKGLCFNGHPDLMDILHRPELSDALRNIDSLDITFNSDHPQILLIKQYLGPFQSAKACVKLLTYEEIIEHTADIVSDLKGYFFDQVISSNLKPGLDRYIIQHHPEYCTSINTIRAKLYRHKLIPSCTRRCQVYRIYQQLILEGDWEIYDDFIQTFYPKQWLYHPQKGYILDGKNPKQRYLYSVIHQLIEKGNIQHLYQILSRLDRLFVTEKLVFYRHCLYSAIRHGKKDLVEYFLPYLKEDIFLFPLRLPMRDFNDEMRYYIGYLNELRWNAPFLSKY